jgi:hypothetical protein
MKWLCLVAAFFLFAGCGDVNWFPDTTTAGGTTAVDTGPKAFTFPPKTATISQAGGDSTSDEVTITGNNPNGWTISLSNSPSTMTSSVLIDRQLFLSDITPHPTIKPGQTLIIDQDVPATVKSGDKLSTIVTIGTTTTEFVTTIQ